MNIVYWLLTIPAEENNGEEARLPMCEEIEDMGEALKLCESLRQRRKSGELISHISHSYEDTNEVGERGAEGPPPGYNWKKRRK